MFRYGLHSSGAVLCLYYNGINNSRWQMDISTFLCPVLKEIGYIGLDPCFCSYSVAIYLTEWLYSLWYIVESPHSPYLFLSPSSSLPLSPPLPFRCVVIHHIPAGETYTFQCNEMEGQYVVVVIPGQNKILTLCEVEVFATVKPPGTSLPVHVFIPSVMVCRIITLMTRIYFLSNTFSGDDNSFPMHVFCIECFFLVGDNAN